MQEVEQELRDRIKDLIRAKKFDDLEELWFTIVEEPARTLTFHQTVIRYLFNRKEMERLEGMYGLLLNQRLESGEADQALKVAKLILEFDQSVEFLRSHLIAIGKAIYTDRGEALVDEHLRISGLEGETPNLAAAYARFEDLMGASVGQVFQHSQWGLGLVQSFDARTEKAVIDFQRKPRHPMTLQGIKNFLRRIPDDHILARIAKAPDDFKTEMFEDPAGTVKLALKNSGGTMKAAQLKKLLTDRFLTEGEYKRFWAKAKDDVRTDPYIDLRGNGANIELVLRKEPRSFVEEVFERFLSSKSLVQRRDVLRDIARHGDNADMTEKDIEDLYKLFVTPLENGMLQTRTEVFGHGLLFEEYAHLFADEAKNPVDVEGILKDGETNPGELISSLGQFELQRIALEKMIAVRAEDMESVFAKVLLTADTKLAMWMEKALQQKEKSDIFEHCMERILGHPDRNPEVYAWIARRVIDGQEPHLAESFPPVELCREASSVLSEAEETLRQEEGEVAKQAVHRANRMRSILQDNHNKYLKKAISGSSYEQARRFLAHISYLSGLTNQLRQAMEDIVLLEHPELRKATGKAETAEEERGAEMHYTTEDSVSRKREELSHILNVEIPANSKAIGAARELGDLRENAEYHAAKDRQKMLMQQAADLEGLIGSARVINLAEVRADQVRFGTRVRLERIENGEIETYTLMGMWEADNERGVISYLTPFGSQLMNRKPEEQFSVKLPDGRIVEYKVIGIEKLVAETATS